MRAVIQRVSGASVTSEGKILSEIGPGLLILIGIEHSDNQEDIEWLSKKITQLRIFNDSEGIMNLSIRDIGGEILLISQFTLHAKTKKGNRPSYIHSAPPEIAIPLYQQFITQLEKDLGRSIGTGIFGAMMQVSLVNDGPVTILIDSKNKE
jgi:D-aminoacyl-tRNA deacylase